MPTEGRERSLEGDEGLDDRPMLPSTGVVLPLVRLLDVGLPFRALLHERDCGGLADE